MTTNPISEPSDELVLKPCPWCGGAAKLYQDWIYGTDKRDPNGWFVRCDPCDLTPDVAWSQPSAEAAVKGWNTRAAIAAMPELSALQDKIRRLEEALTKCRDKFREYELMHLAKFTEDGDAKAKRNREMVGLCDAVLEARTALSHDGDGV